MRLGLTRPRAAVAQALGAMLLVVAGAACSPTSNQAAPSSSSTAGPRGTVSGSSQAVEPESAASITPARDIPSFPSSDLRTVYVLGDSLTYKARKYLPEALALTGWVADPASDSRTGRMVGEGLQILAAASDLPDVILIALGTNNWTATETEAADWIAQARQIIGPDRQLVWVNLHMEGERYATFARVNTGLARGAKQDNRQLRKSNASGRTRVADWANYSDDNRIKHSHDGVHYKAGAYQKRVAFYAAVLTGDRSILPYLE